MPLHPTLVDILLKFQVQVHQLTPNAIAQLSKYFWAVTNFRGIPSSDGFAKKIWITLSTEKIEVGEAVVEVQFGCLNFHVKSYRGSGAKLTIVIKNKWSTGWMRAWFYCKVPIRRGPQGGKGVYVLHSIMSTLDYETEPPIDCLDTDVGDDALVRAAGLIGVTMPSRST
jgi:hypothetical protein